MGDSLVTRDSLTSFTREMACGRNEKAFFIARPYRIQDGDTPRGESALCGRRRRRRRRSIRKQLAFDAGSTGVQTNSLTLDEGDFISLSFPSLPTTKRMGLSHIFSPLLPSVCVCEYTNGETLRARRRAGRRAGRRRPRPFRVPPGDDSPLLVVQAQPSCVGSKFKDLPTSLRRLEDGGGDKWRRLRRRRRLRPSQSARGRIFGLHLTLLTLPRREKTAATMSAFLGD